MRPIWSGAISFGLVTIPIKVFPATESQSIALHQFHTADGGRIRYRKVCEVDGKELTQAEITRGYETAAGTIPVTDEDLDALPLPTAKAIEIVAFVPTEARGFADSLKRKGENLYGHPRIQCWGMCRFDRRS